MEPTALSAWLPTLVLFISTMGVIQALLGILVLIVAATVLSTIHEVPEGYDKWADVIQILAEILRLQARFTKPPPKHIVIQG